jgi:hypothetical protein
LKGFGRPISREEHKAGPALSAARMHRNVEISRNNSASGNFEQVLWRSHQIADQTALRDEGIMRLD